MTESMLTKTTSAFATDACGNRPLASLSLIVLLSSLSSSIANVGLPTLARAFDAPFADVQWVVIAYLLAVTALVVSAGRLGDLLGRRRVLLAGIAVFSGASLLCSLAPSLGWLIAARAVQGSGAAVMMALTLALVGGAVPKERTGRAMGFLGSMSAVGTALGPTLGGLLIAPFGWQAMFAINLPLGLLAAGLAYRHLPDDAVTQVKYPRFDLPGMALLAITLFAYALALTPGRAEMLYPVLAAVTIIGLGLFVQVEMRREAPLVQPALFRNIVFSSGFAMSALVTTVMMATLVVGPFYMSGGLGLSTALAGLVMSAGPVAAALAGVPSGRLVDRFGWAKMTVLGLGLMVVGALVLSVCAVGHGIAGYLLPLVCLTAGFALFQAANNSALLAEARQEQRGVISGLLNLSRNLGFVTGASMMGAVFARASGGLAAGPEAVAHGLSVTFALAAGLILLAMGIALFRLNRQ